MGGGGGRTDGRPSGCVISGVDVGDRAVAMDAAGAPYEIVDAPSPRVRLPAVAAPSPVLVDPAGGVVDVDAIRALLVTQTRHVVVHEPVYALDCDAASWRLGDGALEENTVDIGSWLRNLGLDRYAETFRDNEIDAEVLPSLTAADLSELGVTAIGHRRKLLDAIAGLRTHPPSTDAAEDNVMATSATSTPDMSSPVVSTPLTLRSPDAERRQLTVMFCDLVGSTALSTALDPEDLRDVIGRYHRQVAEVVQSFEGHVAKYMGDGVLAYFGYPHAHEDEAERAVLAGLELVKKTPAGPPTDGLMLQVRVGIATGLAVVGDLLGEGAAREEAVVGETPNLAARLQGLTAPSTVVISHATRQLLGGLFELADLGPQQLKGFPEPVRAWRVLGASRAEGRFEALHGDKLLPLLGREHELGLLLDRWEQAKEGEGQVVLLCGEPGIGKSRMLRAVRERLAEESYTPLSHYCSPYHTSTALHPVISMLERASGLRHAGTPEDKLENLASLLRLATPDLDEAMALLAPLLGMAPNSSFPPLNLPAQRQKQRTLEILIEQVTGLAAVKPVLSIYEDLHWADPSTLELLGMMVDRIQTLPVLLVLTFRPAFTPPWTNYAHATALTLSRFTQRRGSLLITQLTRGKQLPPEVVEQILDKTDGVPLFIEELTKAVLESGLVRESTDQFILTRPLPPLAIPATLQDSLMARLDRLSPVKEVAQIGAVIGREFSHELLFVVADRSEQELSDALDQLVVAELIFRRGVPPQWRYSFKHALVQDAAYESILKARRRQLHTRIAHTLSTHNAGQVEPPLELIAEHFTRAEQYPEAARYWLKAAEKAKAAYANREATSHLHNCLTAAQRIADAARDDVAGVVDIRTTALTLLGDLAGGAGDLVTANRRYDEALIACPDEARRRWIGNKYHHASHAYRDGNRIAFYTHGRGAETLLLVNPLVYGLALFQPILERLCQDFRIITVDCRGTGASDPLRRPFALREHACDVAAVIDTLGGGAVVGVGLSRGSNLLIRLAVERPELISKLVTVGCPLVAQGFASLADYSGYWVECPQAHVRQDVPGLLRILSSWMYTEPGTEELKKMLIERGLRLPPDTVLSFYDDDPDVDVSDLLGKISVPALVTHGTGDQLIPFIGAQYLAREIPGAQLYGFEGKGHLPIFTAPDEFCDVLRRFLKREPLARTQCSESDSPGAVALPDACSGRLD